MSDINKSEISFEREADQAIIRFGENTVFNPETLDAALATLEKAKQDESIKALVITGSGKNFCQGLDLDYLMSGIDGDVLMAHVNRCMSMIAELLKFPVPVVAAVNGHAFGLGAMIVLAADYKVMRSDRGYFCLPEVDLGMVLIPPMRDLVNDKLDAEVRRDALLCGKRYSGTEAAESGIVDRECSEDSLMAQAAAISAPMHGKDRNTLSGLKAGNNLHVIASIDAAQA